MQVESLTLADAVRYHMSTSRNPLEIAVVLKLQGRLTEGELAQFAERLASHARFRQTVVEAPFPGRPKWRPEPAFELAAHVSSHAGAAFSEGALAAAISERLSQPLSFERSPWHLELFPLCDERTGLLFRVHHCVADGLSLVRLLCEVADEPRPKPPGSTPSAPPKSPGVRNGRKHAAEKARALSATLLRLGTARADETRELHELSGPKCVAWSSALDLAGLTRAAEARGCHVTELLLSATSEALSCGLTAAGQPVPPTMRALVPFGASLGRRELGNHYASAFVELVLDEQDPWRRIERMAASTAKLRDVAQAGAAKNLIGLAGWLSPPLMRRAMGYFSRRASLVLSNVPGPQQTVRLLGHDVSSIVVFAPPSASVGLSFTFFGYASELRLGVEVDVALPLQAPRLVEDFERALRRLSESLVRA